MKNKRNKIENISDRTIMAMIIFLGVVVFTITNHFFGK
jgi:hypothetical protein